MTKKIYLETLKSVLGHSILHYSVSNIIKTTSTRELVYNKKYLKADKKKKNIKEGFHCICKRVILIQFIKKMKTIIPKCFYKNVI